MATSSTGNFLLPLAIALIARSHVEVGEYFVEHSVNATDMCMCEYENETIDPAMYNWTEKLTEEDCKTVNGTLVGDCETHAEAVPDVFLFSCALFFGTFVLSFALKNFRNANFFPTKVNIAKELANVW